MKTLLRKAGLLGSVSMAFGSWFWSEQKTEPDLDRVSSADTNSIPSYELKLVQVLFRHGARTPLKTIPDVIEAQWVPSLLEPPPHTHMNYVVTDLNGGPRPPAPVEDSYQNNILSGGASSGQLTTLGMEQLYDLGKRLRRRYIEERSFLSSSYVPAEVYVRSTNITRTIESAKCLLAGLFLQKQREIVPILTEKAESEVFYPNYEGCKLLKTLASQRWETLSTMPDIVADLQSIQRDLGIAAHKDIDFLLLRDDMVARETHGLPSPSALHAWRNTVKERAVEIMCHIYEPNKKDNMQLSVGPVLHILLENIEEKLRGSLPDRKLFLYSAHDTTLIPCLLAMEIFDMKWPPYAADITMELYEHSQSRKAFVKVSYLGQDQLLPGCSDVYCPLQEFKQVMSGFSLSPEQYSSVCNETGGSTGP